MAFVFDGPNRRITLTTGTVTCSVRDVYSRWVDWVATGDNSKYLPAFSTLGGEDIDASSGTKIPIYAFLLNGWKLRPQEASHTLNVTDGVLLVTGGGDPFINTVGSFIVRINYQQPVQAISFSTGGAAGLSLDDVVDGTRSLRQMLVLNTGVMAGKTIITDNGDGTKTVVIRDLADTRNLVVSVVRGRERESVTLNLP